MSGSFGARLRQQREARGISIGTIAEQSKIKASLLEGLERDDVSRWPTGIFRRAYFRAYATAIGLDAETEVREFLATHGDPYEAEAAEDHAAGAPGSPPTRIGMLVGAAVGAISRLRRGAPPGSSRPTGQPIPPHAPALDVPADTGVVLQQEESSPLSMPGTREPAPDITAISRLCTAFGRVDNADELSPLLEEAAGLLGARGLVVWLPDASACRLEPALTHGYSRAVVARLPAVDRGADNPTCRAFQSAEVVRVCDETTGALAVPLLGPAGCVGVLALELPRGSEQSPSVEAVAVIVASLLAPLVGNNHAVPQGRRSPAPAPARRPRATERRRAASAAYR